MPGFLLNKYQMRTLLDMTQASPASWSPLAALPLVPRGCAPGEPDFEELKEMGLVAGESAYAWRANKVAAIAILAACSPEEVIGVKPNHSRIPGFTIVRRDEFVSECTVEARTGDVKIAFPLSRSALILRFIQSLSTSGDDPTPTFAVRLSRDEAFLLSVAVRLEATAVGTVSVSDLLDEAQADLEPAKLAPLAAGGMLPDVTPGSDLAPVLASLEKAGVVKLSGETVQLAEPVRILTEPVRAAFNITRLEVHDGEPKRDGMFVTRHGDRTLLLRTTSDEDPRLVWNEVTRAQLRALIAAFLLPRDELAAWMAHQEAGAATPAATPTPTPVPTATPAPAEPMGTRVVVPPQGLAAWESLRRDRPPVQLDPGLELTLVETAGQMAHVRADNGWLGWVVHNLLQPVAAVAPAVAESQAVAASQWAPTHRAPANGLDARARPDPADPVVARLDPWLEVLVLERIGDWAHIVCSNDWSAWVDGRPLEPI